MNLPALFLLGKYLDWISIRLRKMAASKVLVPGIEGYKIDLLNEIGQGRYGSVFYGTQIATGGEVAVKRMTLHKTGEFKKKLANVKREMEIMKKNTHSNIVTILDSRIVKGRDFLGEEITLAYIVTPLTRLRDLSKYVRNYILTAGHHLDIMAQVASGLSFLHGLGILHRDVKPHNTLVYNEGGRHVYKVCDLGLAKDLTEEGSKMTAVGTER